MACRSRDDCQAEIRQSIEELEVVYGLLTDVNARVSVLRILGRLRAVVDRPRPPARQKVAFAVVEAVVTKLLIVAAEKVIAAAGTLIQKFPATISRVPKYAGWSTSENLTNLGRFDPGPIVFPSWHLSIVSVAAGGR